MSITVAIVIAVAVAAAIAFTSTIINCEGAPAGSLAASAHEPGHRKRVLSQAAGAPVHGSLLENISYSLGEKRLFLRT